MMPYPEFDHAIFESKQPTSSQTGGNGKAFCHYHSSRRHILQKLLFTSSENSLSGSLVWSSIIVSMSQFAPIVIQWAHCEMFCSQWVKNLQKKNMYIHRLMYSIEIKS